MKHIRVFEGFRDEYYTEISDNEWNEWDLKLLDYEEGRIDKPFIDFPLNQFLMLKSRSVNNEGMFRSNWIFTNDKKYRIIGGGYGGGSFNKSHSGIMWVLNVLVEDFGISFENEIPLYDNILERPITVRTTIDKLKLEKQINMLKKINEQIKKYYTICKTMNLEITNTTITKSKEFRTLIYYVIYISYNVK